MNTQAKAIKIQFIMCPIRLPDVLRILISALAVYTKALVMALALASEPMALALASKVHALALMAEALVLVLALRFWPWLRYC